MLSKITVGRFLAPYTNQGPPHSGKPLRLDVVLAYLAHAEAVFLDATKGRAGVAVRAA
ncbi:MAG: hypothetical protein ABSG03_22735 [Bryobacteraceae bacterium]